MRPGRVHQARPVGGKRWPDAGVRTPTLLHATPRTRHGAGGRRRSAAGAFDAASRAGHRRGGTDGRRAGTRTAGTLRLTNKRTSTVVSCITVTAQTVQSSDLHQMSAAAPAAVPPPPAVPAAARRLPSLRLPGPGSLLAAVAAVVVSAAAPAMRKMVVGRTNRSAATSCQSPRAVVSVGWPSRTPLVTLVRSHVWERGMRSSAQTSKQVRSQPASRV